MAMIVDEDHPDLRDPAALLTEAANKAEKLLAQLNAEQNQLELNRPKLNVLAMDKAKGALAETIMAVRQTIDALQEAIKLGPK